MNNLRPYGDRILVQRLEDKEKTSGGIFIPESSKQKNQFGIVLERGSKQDTVFTGDVVFFGKYSGIDIDDTRVILKEEEILGFVQKEDVEDFAGND